MTPEQLQQVHALFLRWCALAPEQNQNRQHAELVLNARHGGRLHDAYEVDLACWATPEEGIAHLQILVERAEAKKQKEALTPSSRTCLQEQAIW